MAKDDRLSQVMVLTEAEAVTPSDSVDLPGAAPRALYTGSGGDVAVIPWNGAASVVLVGLAAGAWHPLSVRRVLVTGTTATDILVGR